MKPLAWLVRRFPGPFGLAWIDDETLVKVDERTYDLRPVRYLASVEAEMVGSEGYVTLDEQAPE